jgi:hypothetical protein
MRVDIGGGQWAEIKPVSELARADRMAVREVIEYETDGKHLVYRASSDDKAAAACLARVCTDWSLPLPPPSTDITSLDRLSLDQDDALRASVEEHLKAIQGKNAPLQENPVPTASFVS